MKFKTPEERLDALEQLTGKLANRLHDLRLRFDGQGGTLAESARWIETTMNRFDAKIEKAMRDYHHLLDELEKFEFGKRLATMEVRYKSLVDDFERMRLRMLDLEGLVKERPDPCGQLPKGEVE